MTRPVNLARPVRCGKCGEKFARTYGREKLCATCKRPDVRARTAAAKAKSSSTQVSYYFRQRQAAAFTGCRYPGCLGQTCSETVTRTTGTCEMAPG